MGRTRAFILCLLPVLASSYYVKVGILSDDPDTEKTSKIWSLAQNYSNMMSLEPVVHVTQWWTVSDAPAMARAVCNLYKTGIEALVFLGPPRWNYLVSSYSNYLGLPFIAAVDSGRDAGRYQVNMMPDTSRAAADFIKHFKWSKFVFIYEAQYGPNQLQDILQLLLTEDFVAEVEAFWRASTSEVAYQYINELLQPNVNRRIVLATSEQFADELVAKLARGRSYHVLLLTGVGIVQRSSNQGFYKLTKLSVVEAEDPILKTLENRLKTIPSHAARGRTRKEIPDSVILHYDSSSTLNTMFNKIAQERPEALKPRQNVDCLQDTSSYSETASYLKRVVIEHGVTGKIKFDETGCRTGYKIHIMQTTPFDVQKVGIWTDSSGLQIAPQFSKDNTSPTYEAFKSEPPLKVLTIVAPPFIYVSPEGKRSGFVIDLLDELKNIIKRDYQLNIVKDGRYGTIVNGQWNGMIGELVRGEADLVVADLTKTRQRAQVVDFSKNIMNIGLNILMKKTQSEMNIPYFGPFTFLTVWSPETWLVILVAVLLYSGGGYGISHFIGAPDRVRALETKGTDKLSPCGSLWFTVGALFCRDTGIYPRNLAHRLWALLWWIFCIFIALLYISMLTSEMVRSRTTITTIHSKKTSQELLKELLDNGSPEIGAIESGSTMSFFKNSEIGVYQQYGRYLQDNPQVLAKSHAEAIERVRNSDGKYAFIMESGTSQLIADSKPCDMVVTSGFLVTKNYAIALQKNSTLKEIIDHGVLSLMETGILRNLYEKWWHNVTSDCEDPNLDILPKVYSTTMTLYEVSGVFYLLIGLTTLSVAAAAIEYYIKTRNIIME